MSIQTKGSLRAKENIKSIFSQVIEEFGVDIISSKLRISNSKVSKIANDGSIEVYQLPKLNDTFGISTDKFLSGDFDMKCIMSMLNNNQNFLPTKYRINPGSKMKTFNFMLKYYQKIFPYSNLKEIHQTFQIGKTQLLDQEAKINVSLLTDFLKYMKMKCYQRNYRAIDISYKTGNYASFEIGQSFLGKKIKTESKASNLFEKFFTELIPHFENNYQYKIKSCKNNEMVIESSQQQENLEKTKGLNSGSEMLCQYKMGILSMLPCLIGQPAATLEKTSSLYRKDKVNTYEIYYSS